MKAERIQTSQAGPPETPTPLAPASLATSTPNPQIGFTRAAPGDIEAIGEEGAAAPGDIEAIGEEGAAAPGDIEAIGEKTRVRPDETPILLNTQAGALHATPGIEQISEITRKLGFSARVIPAGPPDQTRRVIRSLVERGHKTIAVAGGDGTVHLAVQELARSDVALGIIPQGTANNFATALKLPQDLESALRVLKDGRIREVDLGRIGSTYFTEAAGIGLFADALALYGSRSSKNPIRMFYALLRLFLRFRAHRIRLTLDDRVIHERAVMCTVANTFRMGLADPVAPGARVTDGELNVIVVGDLSRRELIAYYRAMKAQAHLKLPKVASATARKITIESKHPMKVHSDDRIVGTTPVIITAEARALRVVVEAR